MTKPDFCITKYCPMCNEEQDHTIQKELTNVYVYHCNQCEREIVISKIIIKALFNKNVQYGR